MNPVLEETVENTDARDDSRGDQVFWIQPTKGWRLLDLSELWEFRELIYFLTWRDIKVRYKQTAIGVAWAVLQPVALMVVFTLFFGRLAKIPSEGIPYPLFAYAGLLPWQIFSRSITDSANSLVKDQRLIAKVYFPRIIVPLAATLAATLDFFIAASLLIVLMIFYGVVPGPTIAALPIFLLLMVLTALGIAFWLSALNVEYRDVTYLMPFLNQFLLFLTPVVYPSTLVPSSLRVFYGLNPMVGVVDGFRWSLFGVGEGLSSMFLLSVGIAVGLFVSGILWFRHKEVTFVDVIGT
jgi:lipopolysaccharide transport system permease protein